MFYLEANSMSSMTESNFSRVEVDEAAHIMIEK